jgi:hypothetical protein
LTEIVLVLDRSGSTAGMRKEAIGGFNSFLESHQKASGQAKLTLVLFDHEYIVAQDDCPVQQVQKLDTRSYQPRGNTALLDAIGSTIKTVGERLDLSAEMMHRPYSKQAPPVIFGHYWLPFGAPHSPLAENVACVDFSAGTDGPLAAYRWDGESQLDSAKFVFSD